MRGGRRLSEGCDAQSLLVHQLAMLRQLVGQLGPVVRLQRGKASLQSEDALLQLLCCSLEAVVLPQQDGRHGQAVYERFWPWLVALQELDEVQQQALLTLQLL